MSKPDILIEGKGFYTLRPNTRMGRDWMLSMLQGYDDLNQVAYCDDTRLVMEFADGSIEAALSVEVNGRAYLGDNRVA